MAGKANQPTSARSIEALLKKLEGDDEALELVASLIEKLAALRKKRRRSIRSQ